MLLTAFDEPVTCFSRTGVRVNVVESIWRACDVFQSYRGSC